ncbi:protein c-Fos [Takifugu flavidus]|uniref:Protein c-Fos n=1 Tax=Takifugu flavidus TaxID=433684 RepID=A0A5C6NPC2_9TELE|nr:protein c-Fos [Takifugu flavidus]XP_056873391.1 protein c-Fos [Takifugu flavidus]XP_056873392.1 protein c-Fos [Takifugu flavidus]TWW68906.1 Proto-oncogene c-Fos [Takifugu flavidus]
MHPDSSTEFDSSSSCTASPGGDTPGRSQQHPPDSLSSSVDSAEDIAADAFVPTVSVISSSPDLRWTVQPAVITSVSPSSTRQKTKSHGATQTAAAHKAKPSNRKGHKEKPSKEEEEKRRIRRERNKIAAAKCRNRRRELIDTLQAETDQLEDEKSALQAEIDELLKEKGRLEHVLAFHGPSCKLSESEGEGDGEEDGDAASAMLQDAPASPQLLSILENGKSPESNAAGGEAPTGQDLDSVNCIPAAAISGNSNILLCSSAEDNDMEDLKGEDLDDLVPSLEMAGTSELAAPVPDIDLDGPFCFSDWETLYKSVANDLDSLCAPVMSSSPSCSNYRTVFSFNYSEIDSLAEGYESLKGSSSVSEAIKDSLNSPTLLAL